MLDNVLENELKILNIEFLFLRAEKVEVIL